MATSQEYIEYLCERLPTVGTIRYRKMFGEYMVYINDKPLLLVCDNTVYVKQLPELAQLMADADRGAPYSGAKEHYCLDIEDAPRVRAVLEIIEPLIPLPQPRRKKQPNR